MATQVQSTIEIRKNRSGQDRAYIAGTRVRVQDIYAMSEIQGLDPTAIVQALPHLSLGQVHGALSHYWYNREAIHQELREDAEIVEQARIHYGPGPLERRLKGLDADRDSVSS